MGYFTYLEMGDELGLTNPLIPTLTFYQYFLSWDIQAQPMKTAKKNPAITEEMVEIVVPVFLNLSQGPL